MKKILFPTDFSEAANIALDYAVAFAGDLGAIVDIMTIYNIPIEVAETVYPHTVDPLIADKRKAVEDQLEQLTAKYPNHIIGNKIAEYGLFIYQEVVDTAGSGNYDCIIMGAKGETDSIDKLMGNVTSHTMMQAPCPVLAVPQEAQYHPIKKIAYATDFIPKDQNAVGQLFKIGQILDASIHFVHVDEKGSKQTSEEDMVFENYPVKFADFTVVSADTVEAGINHFIESKQIDVLSLFVPKRRIWERLFHSSFTKKMTLHSKIPLLAFHQ
jgi:nucleotide-binding universal stress UspA family protein